MRVNVRYFRVPTEWSSRRLEWQYSNYWPTTIGLWEPIDICSPNYTLVPRTKYKRTAYGTLTDWAEELPIELDPFKLRTEFFKLDLCDAHAVQEFLNKMGAWHLSAGGEPGAPQSLVSSPIGFRWVNALSFGTSPAKMSKEREYWRNKLLLLRDNPTKARQEFGPPKDVSDTIHAGDFNNLPFHIEWRHETPQGVIDPICFTELMRVCYHVDLMTGQIPQICARHDCGNPYTGRQKKYCTPECANVEANRALRRRKRDAIMFR